MQPQYLRELIKNLQELYRCPSCDAGYRFDDIRFLAEVETYCFVQLSCNKCSLPVVATVNVVSNGRRAGVRPPVDATVRAVRARKPGRDYGEISASEIAEFHRWISKVKLFTR